MTDWETLGVGGALLARYQRDQQALLEELAMFLEGTLPSRTEVRRTLGVLGPRRTTRLSCEFDGARYVLERGPHEALAPTRTRVVRGVAVRSDPLSMEAWLQELADALGAQLEHTESGRAALSKLLHG